MLEETGIPVKVYPLEYIAYFIPREFEG